MFIFPHEVMKTADDQVIISRVETAKDKCPEMNRCSSNYGFLSPSNKAGLDEAIKCAILS